MRALVAPCRDGLEPSFGLWVTRTIWQAIGRIHRAIVTAIVAAIVAATIAKTIAQCIHTGDRLRDDRLLVARLNRCSSRRRSPVVYIRGDSCRDDRRDSHLVRYRRSSPRRSLRQSRRRSPREYALETYTGMTHFAS